VHELPEKIYSQVLDLSAEGDQLAESRHYREAIAKYNAAWGLVPEPKDQWEASTWLLAAIGDACFLSGHFESGAEAFSSALQCPGGFGNPFVHMRLGQCHLERKQETEAAEHLCRAYAIEGNAIFRDEKPKYIQFLATKIQLSSNGET
jgi:tetratricopeptide (TPR) repeat protein